jgi:hypothetical protein
MLLKGGGADCVAKVSAERLLLVVDMLRATGARGIIITPTKGAPLELFERDGVQWRVWDKAVFGCRHLSRCLIIAVNCVTELPTHVISSRREIGMAVSRDWRRRFLREVMYVLQLEGDALWRAHAYNCLFTVARGH